MRISDGSPLVIKGTVGTGGVTVGDLCVLSSNTFIKATAAPTDGTVVAIAEEAKASGEVGRFKLVAYTPVITARYTGSTKTSLTDADISKVFDLSNSQTVNIDDTTGGCALCVDYDNDQKIIRFVMLPAKKAV